jgi:hypothetical protein
MSSDADSLLISTIMQDAPKSIQSCSEKELRKYLEKLRELVTFLKSKKVEQLLRINDSPGFLKRLYEQHVSRLNSIERCVRNQEHSHARINELAIEEKSLNEKLKLIITKSKELQKHVTVACLSIH